MRRGLEMLDAVAANHLLTIVAVGTDTLSQWEKLSLYRG
jgi:hypothetical protein